ncbi:hypothetical protein [Streptomyces sp. CRN 30]|uniref:hypothetical protein n=1 Tax=Streptomyces sp. CRN 30 TaxID=3075613 RepID=UPI002A7F72E9|nr:hypothetical protein [Streptomyces sp. CRN 30]
MEQQIRLAGSAKQFLREMGRAERQDLADALKSAFGNGNHFPVVGVRMTPEGFRAMLLPIGYLIVFRQMDEFEIKQYDTERGVMVMDILTASEAQPF